VTGDRWNSNLHAFEILLRLVPEGAQRALDVGCGEGETARRLRTRVESVVGIDPDRESIEEAQARDDDIEYHVGSLGEVDLVDASFDIVSSVAMLHHVDHVTGLTQLAQLVRPGGMLLIVGLARSRSPRDFVRDGRDALAIRRHTLTKGVWETPAPKLWPPPLTYSETRAASLATLPDARFERLPYFRYGLTWRAPAT
jgi:ubiquinone/menaquinone biosynthesis C-methylase UbiE